MTNTVDSDVKGNEKPSMDGLQAVQTLFLKLSLDDISQNPSQIQFWQLRSSISNLYQYIQNVKNKPQLRNQLEALEKFIQETITNLLLKVDTQELETAYIKISELLNVYSKKEVKEKFNELKEIIEGIQLDFNEVIDRGNVQLKN